MAELYTDKMTAGLAGVSTSARVAVDECKNQISILDTEKVAYDEAIKNVDRNLYEKIVATNDTLVGVRTEYQKRIEDQNCKSDLFWRVTGISTGLDGFGNIQNVVTVRCTKLSPTYPRLANAGTGSTTLSFTTNGVMWYVGGGTSVPGISTVYMSGDQTLRSAGSTFDTYLQPDNLHGLKLYEEPYDRDIFDTFRASGIGTISAGSKYLTLLTSDLNLDIKEGQIVTSSIGVFPTQNNTVAGVGSTSVDLSAYGDIVAVGTATTTSVPFITLYDAAAGTAEAPGDDGDYTYFTFSQDPNTISDSYAISIEESPYVDQTISLFGLVDLGKGVKIKYDNSGISPATQQWNKFLEGFPNPDLLPDRIVEVEEPKVGAGKIYYPIGFGTKPILTDGSDAVEGDIQVLSGASGFILPLYSAISSSCDDDDLNDAIDTRDAAESELSADTTFDEKITLVNKIRTKRNEINIAIWAYRTQIGDADDRIVSNDSFYNLITNSEYKDLMNNG